eukprot:gene3834-13902_t
MFHLHAHTGCNSTALRPRRDIDGLLTIRPVLRPLVTRHGILRALNSSNWLGPKGGSNGSSNESSNKAKTLQNLSTPPTTFSNVSAWWSRFMGKASYDYYLWRKDTVSGTHGNKWLMLCAPQVSYDYYLWRKGTVSSTHGNKWLMLCAPQVSYDYYLWRKGTVRDTHGNKWLMLCAPQVSYDYYLWRKDTVSDLQLFAIGFFALIMFGSYVKSLVVYGRPPDSAMDFWGELYDWQRHIGPNSNGNGTSAPTATTHQPQRQQHTGPNGSATAHRPRRQWQQHIGPNGNSTSAPMATASKQAAPFNNIFSVFVAYAGILSFAMVLALVEQVVLEVIDSNVKRGSTVYENGHTLVLGWCNSQRDVELIWKLLEQLCNAHQNDPGHTIVVLTQRSKIEMEAMFRRFKPESQRLGTEFVFRVGNPLVPADLQFVAAVQASVTIVVSDHSRNPMEADAQSARCARCAPLPGVLPGVLGVPGVLPSQVCSQMDGWMDGSRGKGGRVVVQMKTSNRMPLVNSCFFVHPCPQVVGRTFGKLAFYFPDAIIIGVLQFICGADSSSGDESQEEGNLCNEDETPLLRNLYSNRKAILNPPLDYMIQPSDELVFVRPTKLLSLDCLVLSKPICTRIQPSDELVFVRPTKLLSLDCLVLSKPIRTRVAPAWTAYTEQLQQQQLQALRLQQQQVVREWTNGDGPITMEKPVTELFSFQQQMQQLQGLPEELLQQQQQQPQQGSDYHGNVKFEKELLKPRSQASLEPWQCENPSNSDVNNQFPLLDFLATEDDFPNTSGTGPQLPSSFLPSPPRPSPSIPAQPAGSRRTSPSVPSPPLPSNQVISSSSHPSPLSASRPSTAKPTAPPSTAPSPRRPSRRSSRSPPEQTPPPISRGALSNFPARVTNDPLGALDSLDDPSSSPSRMESPLYTHVGHEPLETLDSADEKPAEGASGPPLGALG